MDYIFALLGDLLGLTNVTLPFQDISLKSRIIFDVTPRKKELLAWTA